MNTLRSHCIFNYLFAVTVICLVFFQVAAAQEESSPLTKEKEKQSGKKKIKTCTGKIYHYDPNGTLSTTGTLYSLETFNHAGNIIQSIIYSANGEVADADQYRYDSTQKFVAEMKQSPTVPMQKHIFHYKKNGQMDYGQVYMDTMLVHTCTYMYDANNQLSEVITQHHIAIEKNVPLQEALFYQYDGKGNVIKESDFEVELNGTEIKNKKLISNTEYLHNADLQLIQTIESNDKDCLEKIEFRYKADGTITEELHYLHCGKKPDYALKYSYEYY